MTERRRQTQTITHDEVDPSAYLAQIYEYDLVVAHAAWLAEGAPAQGALYEFLTAAVIYAASAAEELLPCLPARSREVLEAVALRMLTETEAVA